MKISIITPTYNSEKTILNTLKSVEEQKLNNDEIEHIIVDGASNDQTLEIVKNKKRKIISEPDKGIYDAINKGIKQASGQIIGILNSDDIFAYKNVLQEVLFLFRAENCDAVYADLDFVDCIKTKKVVRKWKAGTFSRRKIRWGWMPPHPTLFLKKEIYTKYGLYNSNYKIAADYDFILRILKEQKINIKYLPKVTVLMCMGGKSTGKIKDILQKMKEDYKIIKDNKIGGIESLIAKNIRKVNQFFFRSKKNSRTM